MKFVALVSGGKDSYYSAYEAVKNGHELACCAHLAPPPPPPPSSSSGGDGVVDANADADAGREEEEEEAEESYMYQSAASEAVEVQVKECLGVPFHKRVRTGRSAQVGLVYDHHSSNAADADAAAADGSKGETGHDIADDDEKSGGAVEDEVEDLYLLLRSVLLADPTISAVCSGAILSTYQRTRVESVCGRLGLTSLSYLWRIGPQRSLLGTMLRDGFDAVLVKTASPPGLIPRKHLGTTLGQLHHGGVFDKLHDKYDFHVCGEGGEYETLVLDCPLFTRRLVLDETEIEEDEDGSGVGTLRVMKCSSVEKEECDKVEEVKVGPPYLPERMRAFERNEGTNDDDVGTENGVGSKANDAAMDPPPSTASAPKTAAARPPPPVPLAHVRSLPGGLHHVSEILAPRAAAAASMASPSGASSSSSGNVVAKDDDEARLAVSEFQSIVATLRRTLSALHCTPHDVVYVHLYLAVMSHFSQINAHYRDFFGTVLPPSRSCVSLGRDALPGGRRVMVDCVVQRGSGAFMRPPSSPPSVSAGNTNDERGGQRGGKARNNEDDDEFVARARVNPHHPLRSTLHVQSISHWAPTCVGPYSQANGLRGGLVLLAGQIGLEARSMTLVAIEKDGESSRGKEEGCGGGWKEELRRSWGNAASVLDSLDGGGRLDDALGGLVYVHHDALIKEGGNAEASTWREAERICREALGKNGGVEAGRVDGTRGLGRGGGNINGGGGGGGVDGAGDGEPFGGYEDEGTWREVEGDEAVDAALLGAAASTSAGAATTNADSTAGSRAPLLLVALPGLPVGASAEVELVCATRRAAGCLGGVVQWSGSPAAVESSLDDDALASAWDAGYAAELLPDRASPYSSSSIQIRSDVAYVGDGCAAVAYVAASSPPPAESDAAAFGVSYEHVLDAMLGAALDSLGTAAKLGPSSVLHVRLYFAAGDGGGYGNDDVGDGGSDVRCSLRAALGARFGVGRSRPACTVVPVRGLRLCSSLQSTGGGGGDENGGDGDDDWMAMQVLAFDPVHTETEMWIHHGRSYG